MKTVLLLIEDLVLRDLLRLSLKGYHILDTTHGEGSIGWGLAAPQHITLLVSELCLAGESGVQSALRLHRVHPDLKVILVSDQTVQMWNNNDRAGFERLGGAESVMILRPPFFPSVLLHKVQELIGGQDSEN